MAVYYKTVEPILPYISDCASESPQASYFTELLVISGIICEIYLDFIPHSKPDSTVVCAGVLRHFQIRTLLENEDHCQLMELSEGDRNRINWWSNVSVILVFLIGLSLITLASFRIGEMYRLHSLGTLPYFLCGPSLYIIQTWISFRLQPHINSALMSSVRLIIAVIATISVVFLYLFTIWSYMLFKKDWITERRKWSPEDGGYWQHVVAAGAQWLYVLMVSPFFATLVPEFRRLILVKTALFIYKLEGSSRQSSERDLN